MNLLPEELKQEAVDYLLGDMLVCNIPKLEMSDGMGGVLYTDIDFWNDDGKFDDEGNYVLPLYYIQKLTVDGDEYIPIGENIVFDKQLILTTALDIAKEEYPDVYNEIIDVNTTI